MTRLTQCDLYSTLCSPHSLYEAWLRVERNKGGPGVDNQSIDDFKQNERRNIGDISYQLEGNEYTLSPLKGVFIPKDSHQFRKLGIPTVCDRIVFQAINAQLQELWDPFFAPLSFAYRPGKRVADAIQCVKKFLHQGQAWYIKGDIQGCFDSLNWNLLSYILQETLPDERLRKLLNKAIRMPVFFKGHLHERSRGVPQGSPLSPILSNLYLHQFDMQMSDHDYSVIRYGDDWISFVADEKEATRGFYTAADILSDLKIIISPRKSGIGDLTKETISFLGYSVNANEITPSAKAWQNFNDAMGQLKNAHSKNQWNHARARLLHLKAQYAQSCSVKKGGEVQW